VKGLFARGVGRGASLARVSTRSIAIGLYLILMACQPSEQPQKAHADSPASGQVVTENLPCGSAWAERRSEPIKITDSLIVSVPMKYVRYEMLTCGSMTGGIPRAAPAGGTSIGFDFFLPDYGGFTAKTLKDAFAFNQVEVGYVKSPSVRGIDTGNSIEFESTQFNHILKVMADPNNYQDMYGLRCYKAKILKTRMFCHGVQFRQEHREILLIVDIPQYNPGMVNPLMRARYYSSRYGGIEIDWWANSSQLPHWMEIDNQIWKFLSGWNAVGSESKSYANLPDMRKGNGG
jgi:hypothetical protein